MGRRAEGEDRAGGQLFIQVEASRARLRCVLCMYENGREQGVEGRTLEAQRTTGKVSGSGFRMQEGRVRGTEGCVFNLELETRVQLDRARVER